MSGFNTARPSGLASLACPLLRAPTAPGTRSNRPLRRHESACQQQERPHLWLATQTTAWHARHRSAWPNHSVEARPNGIAPCPRSAWGTCCSARARRNTVGPASPQTLGVTKPTARHALSKMSLRCRRSHDSSASENNHKLQLFHLPSVWSSLGLLQGCDGSGQGRTRRNRVIQLGPEGTSVCPLLHLRLPRQLGARCSRSRVEDGREREAVRARATRSSKNPATRWGVLVSRINFTQWCATSDA